jgi:hypothetical protein
MRKIVKPYKNMQATLLRVGLIAPDTEFNRRAAACAELLHGREKSREAKRRKAKRKREAQ